MVTAVLIGEDYYSLSSPRPRARNSSHPGRGRKAHRMRISADWERDAPEGRPKHPSDCRQKHLLLAETAGCLRTSQCEKMRAELDCEDPSAQPCQLPPPIERWWARGASQPKSLSPGRRPPRFRFLAARSAARNTGTAALQPCTTRTLRSFQTPLPSCYCPLRPSAGPLASRK